VVSWVNATHGAQYTVVRRLDGGAQSGAYLLTRPDGSRAVLKWSQDIRWGPRVLRAAPVVRRIREQGYPTPAWLAVGTTDRGFPYQVQEFVEGSPLESLDDSTADLILELTERQAKMDPHPALNVSEHARAVVFGEARARLHASGVPGRLVVEAFDRLCAPVRNVVLPADDMVHGDLGWENIMAKDGAVTGVIDIEAVGSGSRVYDLAKLIVHGYVWDARPTALEKVRRHSEDVAGPDVLCLFAAANAYNLLNFGLKHWDQIDSAVDSILRLAADL
jgi:aminoglycoside phosphotransferase (APT) family kinase protein